MTSHRASFTLPLFVLVLLATFSLAGCAGLTTAGKAPANSNPNPPTTTSTGSLAISATHLTFGNVDLGQHSAQTVTITNTGTSSVTISNVSISGAGYAAAGVPAGHILAPGNAVTLDVTFTPAATGTLTGTVTLATNTNSAETVSLSGTGVTVASHAVTLSWTETTTGVLGYNVYRSTDSGLVYAKLNPALIKTTQYHDPTVQAGQTYMYAATTVDSSDVESAYSHPVTVTVP